jgi:hypothetical protein
MLLINMLMTNCSLYHHNMPCLDHTGRHEMGTSKFACVIVTKGPCGILKNKYNATKVTWAVRVKEQTIRRCQSS